MNMNLLLSVAASELESMRRSQDKLVYNNTDDERKRRLRQLEHEHTTRFPSACMKLLYSIPGKITQRHNKFHFNGETVCFNLD